MKDGKRENMLLAYPAITRLAVVFGLATLGAACTGGSGEGASSSAKAVQAAQVMPSAQASPASAMRPTTLNYGKAGDPVNLVVGYQPYYTGSWSGVVIRGKELWKNHLPPGSTVTFESGLQGAIIVNAMLAGKQQIGYLGDMPAIVATTKRETGDIRMVGMLGLSKDMCNIFFVRKDAPQFSSQEEAVKWMDGKKVAVTKGACTDRFAQSTFKKLEVTPGAYYNQSIEVITSGFRVGKLDAAVVWEPTATKLETEGLARRVASGDVVGELDGGMIDMRGDLIDQRPDIVKAWLRAELEAQQFVADPKNRDEIIRMVKEQTTGIDEATLHKALYGPYPASVGGNNVRITMPLMFTPDAKNLIETSTAFLHANKSISIDKLPENAIEGRFAEEVVKEANLPVPFARVTSR